MPDLILLTTSLLLPALLWFFVVNLRRSIPEAPLRTPNTWFLLSSKMVAAHVYYVKRTARCRRGRSPRSVGSSLSRSRSASNLSFEPVEHHPGRLRAWRSWRV
jgi:hypothetical protein